MMTQIVSLNNVIRKYNFVILHQRIKMREFQKLMVISFQVDVCSMHIYEIDRNSPQGNNGKAYYRRVFTCFDPFPINLQ